MTSLHKNLTMCPQISFMVWRHRGVCFKNRAKYWQRKKVKFSKFRKFRRTASTKQHEKLSSNTPLNSKSKGQSPSEKSTQIWVTREVQKQLAQNKTENIKINTILKDRARCVDYIKIKNLKAK